MLKVELEDHFGYRMERANGVPIKRKVDLKQWQIFISDDEIEGDQRAMVGYVQKIPNAPIAIIVNLPDDFIKEIAEEVNRQKGSKACLVSKVGGIVDMSSSEGEKEDGVESGAVSSED